MLSISCGSKTPKVITKTETKPILPPKQWMEPINHPKLRGDKNRDLWIFMEKQIKTLDKYKIKMDKLREWRQEWMEKENLE